MVSLGWTKAPASDSSGEFLELMPEQQDAHRKRQQAQHPKLTITGMYNVLEKLRAIERAEKVGPVPTGHRSEVQDAGRSEPALPVLTDKEKTIHEQGLVSVLKQIHDDLDAAVFEAYGWPVTLTDEEILERLVALNAERDAEEKRGLIRWLRPEFQNPDTGKGQQKVLAIETDSDHQPGTTAQPK